jgi:hypothetical protein
MIKLTKEEIVVVRRGADLIARDAEKAINGDKSAEAYACNVLGGYLAIKLKDFYDPPIHAEILWQGLRYFPEGFTIESQLQRELMLELFAHLKGVL